LAIIVTGFTLQVDKFDKEFSIEENTKLWICNFIKFYMVLT
jgi:uncharacterized protein YfbU (UPF0304 family)